MKYPIEPNSKKHSKKCCTHYGTVTVEDHNYNIFTCGNYPDKIIAMCDSWESWCISDIKSAQVDSDRVWKKGIALIRKATKPPKIKWLPLDMNKVSVKSISKRKIKRLK